MERVKTMDVLSWDFGTDDDDDIESMYDMVGMQLAPKQAPFYLRM